MLNLRVCRRSKENIILLWDTKLLSVEEKQQIKIFNEDKPLKIHVANSLSELTGEQMNIPDYTAVCLINHEENNLQPMDEYTLTVKIGNEQQDIDILPYGVLPETEKDDKQKHVQIMAWDKKRKRWRKVEGVETANGFALLIKMEK